MSRSEPGRPRLIVADDLGSWPRKTDAIVAALESELITSASVMANFDDFERACALVSEHDVGNRVGAHLVLTEGVPLTTRMRRSSRFCDGEGRFRGQSALRRLLRLSSDERGLVAGELRAQTDRMRDHGLTIAHLDSHHHVHIQPALSPIVIHLARELAVPRVRLAPNVGRTSLQYQAYSRLHNVRLRRQGLAATRYAGSLTDFLALAPSKRPLDDYELIVHPVSMVTGEIEDDDVPGELLSELLARCRSEPGP